MDFRNAAARASSRLNAAVDFGRRREPAEGSNGFYDSSFELKRGLEVCEAPAALLPEEILREFRRQIAN